MQGGRLGSVKGDVAARLIEAIIELPETIELLSLRTLGWPMAELVNRGASLNLLSLEALAAARYFDAEICLAAVDANKPLVVAAPKFGIGVRSIVG